MFLAYADETKRLCIIGFSRGKDSTVLLQLVWRAIEPVKEISGFTRPVHVVCNVTMVENPIITNYVNKVLDKNIKAIREMKQMSQGDICRDMGCDRAFISNLESGKANLTLDELLK